MQARKGVFFTLASMFFLGALFLIFSANVEVKPYGTQINQVFVVDEYRENIESLYIPLIVRHAAYQALVADSDEAYNRDIYLALPTDWNETVWHGTLRSVAVPNYKSLPTRFAELEAAGVPLGYNLSIKLQNISLIQSGPFQGSYAAGVDFNLSSKDNTTTFNRSVTIIGTVSLIGIPDLYYNLEGKPLGLGKHNFTPYLALQGWNNTAVLTMTQTGTYRIMNTSPDIFARLQGNTVPSKWGVESFVAIGAPSLVPNGTSIDVEYYTQQESLCTYQQPSIYASLRLNLTRLFDYNITGASIAYNPGGCPLPP